MCWECVLVRHSATAAREQLEEMSLRVELTSPGWQRALYPLGNINSPAFLFLRLCFIIWATLNPLIPGSISPAWKITGAL